MITLSPCGRGGAAQRWVRGRGPPPGLALFLFLLLVLEQAAGGARAFRVDGVAAPVDMLDDAVAVDNESGAVGQPHDRDQNAVVPRDGLLLVAQEGKLQAQLLRKGFVLGPVVDADPDDLGARLLEFGDISLIRRKLLGSTWGEGLDVKRQHDRLLAAKVAELHGRAALVRQDKVGRAVTNLEWSGAPGRQHPPQDDDDAQSSRHEDSLLHIALSQAKFAGPASGLRIIAGISREPGEILPGF